MNIKRTLSLYHDNITMADSLNWFIPGLKSIIEDDFGENITFKKGDFTFKVTKAHYVLHVTLEVEIWVDDILVYKDGWKHHLPIEMKNKFKEIMKEIVLNNKEYRKLKLYKKYEKNRQLLDLKKEQADNENYKKEQQYLLSKFK